MLTALEPVTGDDIVTLEEAKAFLSIEADDTSFDTLIPMLRADAIDFVERYTSVSLQARDFLWTQDHFTSAVKLPIGPVSEVTAISYYNSDGEDVALDDSAWFYGRGSIVAAPSTTWPTASGVPGGVRITFEAGYTLAAYIPPSLLLGVRAALAAIFANREQPDFTAAMACCDRVRRISL